MKTTSRRWRTLLVIILAGLVLPIGVGAAPATEDDDAVAGRVDGSVRDEVEKDGEADFWVVLDSEADLSDAKKRDGKVDKARSVRAAKTRHAAKTQAGLRGLLDEQNVTYESFWLTNAILVKGGDEELLDEIAGRPEVARIEPDEPIVLPEPEGTVEEQVDGVEWNVDRINAPRVWDELGVRGEDVVVANIDSGVQYDHPALVNQYRGTNEDGTFTHDYNWFDPAGICGGEEPCDNHGHGTHTMGTMVGDDGDGNQVGVAPGAKWIAAKGCESNTCSAASLLAAGQWILAPTDANGENPRPDLAPDVVNNSWGGPGGQTWFNPMVEAWVAAGIFPSFSGGNSGPGCNTARYPGELTVSYASGAFDIDNQIADFSSRGPGEGGEIKPNLAAPGVNVRSTLPGDAYGANSGTSMAAPHTTAVVALMWSASPTIRGDVGATRELLDTTAIDTPDDQCGGSEADNNVWGEGRLDALAAVQQSPRGDLGGAAGKVTDADGAPLAGATVTFDGPLHRVRTTADDGSYSLEVLLAGDYTVTVEKYGYGTVTDTVTVLKDETTTADFTLQRAPSGTLHGTVTDGSGHGWPLYAKITVDGYPDGPVFTDPYTGAYTVDLPQQATHTLHITPVLDGYQPTHDPVQVDNADVHHDITVPIDPAPCTAPGYRTEFAGFVEDFTGWIGTTPQNDWTVTDNIGNGYTWRFDSIFPTPPGGDADFAIADVWDYGVFPRPQDTALVSPRIDLTDRESPAIQFDTTFVADGFGSASGTVELSVDDGETWQTVQTIVDAYSGPVDIPIPQAAGERDVRVRFHYNITNNILLWWSLDNAQVGTSICGVAPGGLVAGAVSDANTGNPVNDAKIASMDGPAESGTTAATPDDPNVPDGFYQLFASGAGDRDFTASKGAYASSTETVDVVADAVTRHDWSLRAGHLIVSETSISGRVELGELVTRAVTLTNDGTAPMHVRVGAHGTGLTPMDSQRSTATPTDAWAAIPEMPEPLRPSVADSHDGKVYVIGGDSMPPGRGFSPTAKGYVYAPSAGAWSAIADAPEVLLRDTAGAFVGGEFYVAGNWGDSSSKATYAYNPMSDSWRRVADLPRAVHSAAAAVLDGQLYVVAGCVFRVSNSCGIANTYSPAVYRYDPDTDKWNQLADYPALADDLACAGIAETVVCAGGTGPADRLWRATYVYHPQVDAWTRGAQMPYKNWDMAYGAANDRLIAASGRTVVEDDNTPVDTNRAAEYDPVRDVWSELPSVDNPTGLGAGACGFYLVGGGPSDRSAAVLPGYDQCTPQVPWLTTDSNRLDLAVGESVTVRVTMDSSAVSQPGDYAAELWVNTDSPYYVKSVTATLRVDPPKTWGKVAGTVTDARNGEPIALATVAVCVKYRNGTCGPRVYALKTDLVGRYQLWLDSSFTPLQVSVAKDGYQPEGTVVPVRRGRTTIADFALVTTATALSWKGNWAELERKLGR